MGTAAIQDRDSRARGTRVFIFLSRCNSSRQIIAPSMVRQLDVGMGEPSETEKVATEEQ